MLSIHGGFLLIKLILLAPKAIVYLFATLVYNVFFHPLREYPGPLLSRAHRLVWDYHAFNGDLLRYVVRLHETYGEVVRIAPNELSYITPQAVSNSQTLFLKEPVTDIVFQVDR